jgi:hypothetical protein
MLHPLNGREGFETREFTAQCDLEKVVVRCSPKVRCAMQKRFDELLRAGLGKEKAQEMLDDEFLVSR